MPTLLKLFLGFLLLLLLAAAGLLIYGRSQLLSQRDAQRAATAAGFESFHEAVLADQQFAAALPVFQLEHGEADAGAVLNPGLRWKNSPTIVSNWRASLPDGIQAIELPSGVRPRLSEPEWVALDAEALTGADFAWMGKLQEYGFWDLETASPLERTSALNHLEVPMPAFRVLVAWGKLRLVKGAREGELLPAIDEVRHLARLLLTTESLLGELAGVDLLALEQELHHHLAEAGGELPEGWTPLQAEELVRLRRTLEIVPAYTHLDAPDSHFGQAQELPVGLCAGVAESGWAMVLNRPLLSSAHEEAFSRFEDLLERTKGRCRLKRLRATWQKVATEEGLQAICATTTQEEPTQRDLSCGIAGSSGFFSGGLRMAGELYFSLATPEHWGDYRSAK